jgi:cell wall-associated NlpC family hydrolase
VRHTSIPDLLRRSRDGRLVVKRLRAAPKGLDKEQTRKLVSHLSRYAGKPYDILFEWSDSEIYCSELIWKAFHDGLGLSLGEVGRWSDLNWRAPEVKSQMEQRYTMRGRKIDYRKLMEEKIVTPQAIYASPLLLNLGLIDGQSHGMK